MEKIKVLIVDDSAVVRQIMEAILSSDPEIEVIATASDPYIAANKIQKEIPDVITLDIEMPRMDGITFLQKIMTQHPIPVVICSSIDNETVLKVLEYGAVEVITKPKIGIKNFFEESKSTICNIIKAASKYKVKPISLTKIQVEKKLTADVILPPPAINGTLLHKTTEKIVSVGASTGGTEALRIFLQAFPYDCPGIVIVQHMPAQFTTTFAKRLNEICNIQVKEASDGDSVLRGRALIAPGDKHMLLKRSGTKYSVEIKDGPLVSRHRPSVDVLFRSTARYAGANAIGVIMTGMGDDGARGMLEMKQAKAFNIAQDEESCVVFGMPQKAIEYGGVDKILPLSYIAAAVLKASI